MPAGWPKRWLRVRDTGAMYRTLAWYCLFKKVDVHDPKAVAASCASGRPSDVRAGHVRLLVNGRYARRKSAPAETSAAVPDVARFPRCASGWSTAAGVPPVRQSGDGGRHRANVFPETEFKFLPDAARLSG